jgi:hypothetical protein
MSNIIIDIAAEFTGKKAFKDADSATKKLSNTAKTLAKSFGLAYGTAAVIGFAKASVKAAADDQKAQQQLALALKNVGLGRDSAGAERFIQSLQSEFGVVDDLLRPAYQELAVATRDSAESQKLLSLALDISASTGKDLSSVTGALSKAFLGNNTALSKLGVGISKADLKSKSFKKITDELAITFKGSAKAASETFAGSIAKLGVASANVKEIIGTGLIDALTMLGDDKSVSELATNMENAATNVANFIRGVGLLVKQLDKIPGGFKLDVAMIPIIGTYLSLITEAGAKAARIASAAASKNPIQSGSYLNVQKQITKLTKEQTAAELAKLKAKQLSLAIDKANLALGKGTNIFDNDAITLNAAMINQAKQLGMTQDAAAAAMIIADMQRIKIKQDMIVLEDAIASKDTARIEAATKQLNADIGILGALTGQNNKLIDIKSILDGFKTKDLINLDNLTEALRLLAQFKFPTLTIPGVVIPPAGKPPVVVLPPPVVEPPPPVVSQPGTTSGGNLIKELEKIVPGATSFIGPTAGGSAAAIAAIIAKVDLEGIAQESFTQGINAGVSFAGALSGARYAAQAAAAMGAVKVEIVDKTSGLIEVVQNAVIQNNRYGNNLTYAGTIE